MRGNTYYTNYLAVAKQLGIANGIGNNQFARMYEITRQEMFTLLYNALTVIENSWKETLARNFGFDASQIAFWAKERHDIACGNRNCFRQQRQACPRLTVQPAQKWHKCCTTY